MLTSLIVILFEKIIYIVEKHIIIFLIVYAFCKKSRSIGLAKLLFFEQILFSKMCFSTTMDA